MYRSGEAKAVLGETDAQGYPIEVEPYHDAREKTNFPGETPPLPRGTVYLPHSCQEWVIGGPEQIQALIDDLTILLAQYPRPSAEDRTSGQ